MKKKRSSALDSFKKKRKAEVTEKPTKTSVVDAAKAKLAELQGEDDDSETRSGTVLEANGFSEKDFHTPSDGNHTHEGIDLRKLHGSKDDPRVRALIFTEEKFFEAIPGWTWSPTSFRTKVGGPGRFYAYLISTGSTIATLEKVLKARYSEWIKEIRPSIAYTLLEELGLRNREEENAKQRELDIKDTRITIKRAVGDRTTYDYPAGCDTDEKRRKYRKQQRALRKKGAKADAD